MTQPIESPSSILQNAKEKISQILGKPVTVYFRITRQWHPEHEIRIAVIRATGISWREILSHSQILPIVEARQFWCYFNSIYSPSYSSVRMGKIIGRRHDYVLRAVNAIKDRIAAKDARTLDLEKEILKGLCHEI